MIFTYTGVHSKGEEEFHKASQIFQDLGYWLSSVFSDVKCGILNLSFEKPEDFKNDFDSGIVKGENFVLEKIDRYGDNPMYYYSDSKGTIFVQTRFVMSSSVKFGDKTFYGGEIMVSPEAMKYIEDTKNNLKELIPMPLREQLDKVNNSKKL